jgi:tRNA pseudouridine55 synthase
MSGKRLPGRGKRSGFLAVNKPLGMTSHDVVARVRRRFGYHKVGHAGTLDPMAEGVLVIGVGREATRRLGEVMGHDKEYRAVMLLGVTTDSQDAEGKVLEMKAWSGVTREEIRATLARFKGLLSQVPPMHSALKRRGRPLYSLARRGVVVRREPRSIRIHELELCGFDGPEVRFRVVCSKGTYVRTLCADIGDALGCGAHLKRLVRTRVGSYLLETAMKLDELLRLSQEEFEGMLQPPGARS